MTDPQAGLVVSVLHHLAKDEVQGQRMNQRILRGRKQLVTRKQKIFRKNPFSDPLSFSYLFPDVKGPRDHVVGKERRVERTVEFGVDALQGPDGQVVVK